MSAAHAVRVFPSGTELPQNLLRMHLYFDEAPNVDAVASAVRLLGKDGHEIAHPFLDLHDGLWDATGTRMTLLLYPGRIKSGLAARDTLGPSMQAGRAYQLVLDMGRLFGDAAPASNLHTTTFNVIGPLESALDASAWELKPPAEGSSQPLRLAFKRPLDRMNLEHAFALLSPGGGQLPFGLTVSAFEHEVMLLPTQPWPSGEHVLHVSHELEDVAGNRLAQTFEQMSATQLPRPPPTTTRVFKPTPPA
jgi:hypothetical protein